MTFSYFWDKNFAQLRSFKRMDSGKKSQKLFSSMFYAMDLLLETVYSYTM